MKLLYILLIFSPYCFSQNSISLEVIPKTMFSNYVGEGIKPVGFELRKINPSISFGLIYNHNIKKKIYICYGLNYHINNYYSLYYRDFNSNKKVPFNHSSNSTFFFEPKILLKLNEIHFLKFNKIFFDIGFGYSISNSIDLSYKNQLIGENAYGKVDTVTFKTSLYRLNPSRFKFLLNVGKTFAISKTNFQFGIGLNVKLGSAETMIVKEITDNNKYYKFNYKRNSSHIGINLNLIYNLKKRTTQ